MITEIGSQALVLNHYSLPAFPTLPCTTGSHLGRTSGTLVSDSNPSPAESLGAGGEASVAVEYFLNATGDSNVVRM